MEYSANQLRNERNGSGDADLRLLPKRLTEVARSERRETLQMRKILKAASAVVGEKVPGFLRARFLTLLLLPAYFFFFGWGGGDYGTMHLPAEAAATRCSDLNTAAWRDDWLRGEAGVVEGGVGTGLGWRSTSTSPVSVGAPLKFKYLSELEIDPFL